MKSTFLTILFSVFTMAVFAQDLKNPRLETTGGSLYSSGNFLLFIDPGKYIKPSKIALSDVEDILNDWKHTKAKITALEKQLNEQKKENDELKRLVKMQQQQFDEQKRKIEDLLRKVK